MNDYNYLPLDGSTTSLSQLERLLQFGQHISITYTAYEQVEKCRQYLDGKMEDPDRLYYGINTGFGYLQDVKIDTASIEQLQYNLLMSHA